jgi:hypothetical protein
MSLLYVVLTVNSKFVSEKRQGRHVPEEVADYRGRPRNAPNWRDLLLQSIPQVGVSLYLWALNRRIELTQTWLLEWEALNLFMRCCTSLFG